MCLKLQQTPTNSITQPEAQSPSVVQVLNAHNATTQSEIVQSIERNQNNADESGNLNSSQMSNVVTEAEEESAELNEETLPVLDEQGMEELFSKAQDYANRMEYEKSIALLSGVTKTTPYESRVNDKIRSYSNSSVLDLRNKAAEVYQFARHASGDERESLLRESLQILECAVEKFPQSDQIASIKQNIERIKRDL